MNTPRKTAVYDETLRLEAYRFEGIAKPFPNHFHTYYVIGLVEQGQRRLTCQNQTYDIQKGHVLLFNPCNNHGCVQSQDGTMDYLGLNISREVMVDAVEEVSGTRALPEFSSPVVWDEEICGCLAALHRLILEGGAAFEKEEQFLLLLSLLLHRYGQPFEASTAVCGTEIERACAFMEEHYPQRISLEQICRSAGLSKSTLLRAFAKAKGITPYRYLENIRIEEAKKLLEQGAAPAQAALQTGFSDQSHFTNYFSRFIGLPPGFYRDIFREK